MKNKRRFIVIAVSFGLFLAGMLTVFARVQRHKKVANTEALCRSLSIRDLGQLLIDQDSDIKLVAAKEIDMRAKMEPLFAIIPDLTQAVNDENEEVVRLVVWALEATCSKRPEVLLVFIEGLKNKKALTRRDCAAAIGNCELEAKDAIPALLEALSDNDTRVRRAASNALRLKVRPDTKTAVVPLFAALKDKDHEVRAFSAEALANIGPEADKAIPALMEAAIDPVNDWTVRYSAALAIGRIGPNALPAVPTLIRVILNKSENRLVRPAATKALGEIGPDAREAIPALKECLKDSDYSVRAEAAYALWRIDQNMELVVPAAIEILNNDKDFLAQRRVVGFVGELGNKAKPAVPALIKVMEKEVDSFRPHVIAAIQKIDPEAAAKVNP
jgi:HEAT repeat protein